MKPEQKRLKILLESCEEFMKKRPQVLFPYHEKYLATYYTGEHIAENLSYTKKDLEELSKKIIIK